MTEPYIGTTYMLATQFPQCTSTHSTSAGMWCPRWSMIPGGTDDDSNNCDFRGPFFVSCTSLKVLFLFVVPRSPKLEFSYPGVLSRARMSTSFLGSARRMYIQNVASSLGGFSSSILVTVTPVCHAQPKFRIINRLERLWFLVHRIPPIHVTLPWGHPLSLIGLSTPRPSSRGHNDRHPEEPSLCAVSFGSSKIQGAKTRLKLLPSFSTFKKKHCQKT